VAGKSNWGRSTETLDMVIKARNEGYDVTIDQYPYTASSTNLAVTLPDWALEGGLDSLRVKLKDPVQRKKVLAGMKNSLEAGKRKDYSYAVVAGFPADTMLNGKSITQINLDKGRKKKFINEANTILDMLAKSNAQMIYHTMSEKDLAYFMKYPFNMPAADGGISNGKGMPHPRAYGTNARVLAKYVREDKVIGLEEAVRRMTSLPARKFGLKERGLLAEGMKADILVFDEKNIQDLSVYDKPHQYTKGIEYVLVNGQLVLDNGNHTGVRSGTTIKGNQ
jgi:N-acyl-D-amino-acid deacylase